MIKREELKDGMIIEEPEEMNPEERPQYKIVSILGTVPIGSDDECDFVPIFDHDLSRFEIVP